MEAREEVVEVLTSLYAVEVERIDEHNYPFQHTESMWEDHLRAAEAIHEARGNYKRRIMLRRLDILNSGRVVWRDVKTVWQAGEWVDPEHNPLYDDPQFREYLRLKEIYGDLG